LPVYIFSNLKFDFFSFKYSSDYFISKKDNHINLSDYIDRVLRNGSYLAKSRLKSGGDNEIKKIKCNCEKCFLQTH